MDSSLCAHRRGSEHGDHESTARTEGGGRRRGGANEAKAARMASKVATLRGATIANEGDSRFRWPATRQTKPSARMAVGRRAASSGTEQTNPTTPARGRSRAGTINRTGSFPSIGRLAQPTRCGVSGAGEWLLPSQIMPDVMRSVGIGLCRLCGWKQIDRLAQNSQQRRDDEMGRAAAWCISGKFRHPPADRVVRIFQRVIIVVNRDWARGALVGLNRLSRRGV